MQAAQDSALQDPLQPTRLVLYSQAGRAYLRVLRRTLKQRTITLIQWYYQLLLLNNQFRMIGLLEMLLLLLNLGGDGRRHIRTYHIGMSVAVMLTQSFNGRFQLLNGLLCRLLPKITQLY